MNVDSDDTKSDSRLQIFNEGTSRRGILRVGGDTKMNSKKKDEGKSTVKVEGKGKEKAAI